MGPCANTRIAPQLAEGKGGEEEHYGPGTTAHPNASVSRAPVGELDSGGREKPFLRPKWRGDVHCNLGYSEGAGSGPHFEDGTGGIGTRGES